MTAALNGAAADAQAALRSGMISIPARAAAAAAVVTVVAATAAGQTAAPAASAGPATVDNPQYAAWAGRKVGTSVTLVCQGDGPAGSAARVEVTQTLKSVTADAATVVSATKLSAQGQVHAAGRPTVLTVPARVPPADMRQTGTDTVAAMGRSFACRVYQVAQPVAGGGSSKAVAYLNDAVPGGVVKLVVANPAGGLLAFVVATVDEK